MKFALLNPNWDFKGSTYFGCQEAHIPLELMFAADQLRAASQESLLVDAQTHRPSQQRSGLPSPPTIPPASSRCGSPRRAS